MDGKKKIKIELTDSGFKLFVLSPNSFNLGCMSPVDLSVGFTLCFAQILCNLNPFHASILTSWNFDNTKQKSSLAASGAIPKNQI